MAELHMLYILLGEGCNQLWQYLVLDHRLGHLLGMVGDPAQGQGCAILDGYGGIDQQRPQLLERPQGVQVVDVLGLGGEVGQLLGELDLRLLELLEGRLQSLHLSYKII